MSRIDTVKSLIRRAIGCGALEDLSMEQRLAAWPGARTLEPRHLQNCRLYPERRELLHLVPKGGVCAEVGVWKGEFSQSILEVTTPSRLHLIDFAKESIDLADRMFAAERASGVVQTHHGLSVDTLNAMPDNYFDWLYIDADHRYEGIYGDLRAARAKMKPGGLLAINDYIYFAPVDFAKYGVVEAVNEFCLEFDYEFVAMALHPRMYMDVLLRPIAT